MTRTLVKLPAERIEQAIFAIRGEKVMLDRDLAALYGVSTKVFNQAVTRHLEIPARLHVSTDDGRG